MTVIEKTGLCASIGVIVVLLCLIVFSKNGVLDYKVLKSKETAVLDQVQTVDRENKKLEHEINRLKTDMTYIKHVAKHEHDMAEQDEFIFKGKSDHKGDRP